MSVVNREALPELLANTPLLKFRNGKKSAADLYAGGSPDFGVDLDLKSSTKRIVSQTVVSTLNFT
jgi:hypothetical protein